MKSFNITQEKRRNTLSHNLEESNAWKKVFATHEERQSTRLFDKWPGDLFPGVALPSRKAQGRWVILRHGDKFCCAQVCDLGPWCHDDDAYVMGSAKPRAERYKDQLCPVDFALGESARASVPDGNGNFKTVDKCNGAGIDLLPYVANLLGIPIGENCYLEWRFVEL